MTWYIIDTRIGEIVNAVETSGQVEPDLSAMYGENVRHMRLDPYPPDRLLNKYKFYNERP